MHSIKEWFESLPYLDGRCVVWILHLVSDMPHHVFNKFGFINETRTVPV